MSYWFGGFFASLGVTQSESLAGDDCCLFSTVLLGSMLLVDSIQITSELVPGGRFHDVW